MRVAGRMSAMGRRTEATSATEAEQAGFPNGSRGKAGFGSEGRTHLLRTRAAVLAGCCLLVVAACAGEDRAVVSTIALRGAPIDSAPAARVSETSTASSVAAAAEKGMTSTARPSESTGAAPEARPGDVAEVPVATQTQPRAAEAAPQGTLAGVEAPASKASAVDGEKGRNEASASRDTAEAADDDSIQFLDFADLDWPEYVPSEEREVDEPEVLDAAAFPGSIRKLDGRRISLAGFMIAIEFEDKALQSFLLARFPPGCCFGAIPVFYEWIQVEVPAGVEAKDYSPYVMITVTGRLHVGERLDEDGYATGIYRMTCESVVDQW